MYSTGIDHVFYFKASFNISWRFNAVQCWTASKQDELCDSPQNPMKLHLAWYSPELRRCLFPALKMRHTTVNACIHVRWLPKEYVHLHNTLNENSAFLSSKCYIVFIHSAQLHSPEISLDLQGFIIQIQHGYFLLSWHKRSSQQHKSLNSINSQCKSGKEW